MSKKRSKKREKAQDLGAASDEDQGLRASDEGERERLAKHISDVDAKLKELVASLFMVVRANSK